jgi:hypothetical protein
MVTRKKAETDAARQRALDKAKAKKDSVAEPENVLKTVTIDKLDAMQPLFKEKMGLKNIALTEQGAATTAKDLAIGDLKMHNSHFLQVFDFGIDRKVFPKEHRPFYHLDMNSKALPQMNTDAEIIQVGEWIIEGEAQRIIAGGAAMAMPTAVQVGAKLTAAKNAIDTQSTKKDAYDDAQEVVADLRVDADKVILSVWDEVEATYNSEPIESKRRHAREWGVVYVSTQTATISGNVTKQIDGSPLEFVNVALLETGNIVQTDAHGHYEMKTNFAGDGTLEFTLDGYVAQTFAITLEEGGTLAQDAVMRAV